jgi:hypothetical protein
MELLALQDTIVQRKLLSQFHVRQGLTMQTLVKVSYQNVWFVQQENIVLTNQ